MDFIRLGSPPPSSGEREIRIYSKSIADETHNEQSSEWAEKEIMCKSKQSRPKTVASHDMAHTNRVLIHFSPRLIYERIRFCLIFVIYIEIANNVAIAVVVRMWPEHVFRMCFVQQFIHTTMHSVMDRLYSLISNVISLQ